MWSCEEPVDLKPCASLPVHGHKTEFVMVNIYDGNITKEKDFDHV